MRIHPSFCIIKNKDKHWLTMLMDFFEFWGFPALMTHSKKTQHTSDDKGFIFWLGSTHNLKYQNCFTVNEINSGGKKKQPQESSCQVSGSPLCLLLYTVNHALDGSSDGLINYSLFFYRVQQPLIKAIESKASQAHHLFSPDWRGNIAKIYFSH